MTAQSTITSNENGDAMEKPTRKRQTFLLGTVIVLVIIVMNSSIFGTGGKKGMIEEDSRTYAALELALMEIEGVGEVTLYFHYDNDEEKNPLTDYFSLSTPQAEKRTDNLQGILVIAEGAADPSIQHKLMKILSAVIQLPEHRIVIVEMKKRGIMNENE